MDAPALRDIYDAPFEHEDTPELRDVALRRIFELSPEEGRSRILEEIATGARLIGAETLGLLPDDSLPELDPALLARLERSPEVDARLHELKTGRAAFHDEDTAARLIERYASPGLRDAIVGVYDTRQYSGCRSHAALLSYLLRVDRDGGLLRLRAALADRGPRWGCFQSLLSSLAELRFTSDLEEIAVEHLFDPDIDVAGNAADVLGRLGSAAAERPLWERLEALSREWPELVERQVPDRWLSRDARPALFEDRLVQALSQGGGWLADRADLERLLALCSTESCRTTVAGNLDAWLGEPLRLNGLTSDGARWSFSLAQYQVDSVDALVERLAQLPAGMRLMWKGPDDDFQVESRAMLERLRDAVRASGISIEEEG